MLTGAACAFRRVDHSRQLPSTQPLIAYFPFLLKAEQRTGFWCWHAASRRIVDSSKKVSKPSELPVAASLKSVLTAMCSTSPSWFVKPSSASGAAVAPRQPTVGFSAGLKWLRKGSYIYGRVAAPPPWKGEEETMLTGLAMPIPIPIPMPMPAGTGHGDEGRIAIIAADTLVPLPIAPPFGWNGAAEPAARPVGLLGSPPTLPIMAMLSAALLVAATVSIRTRPAASILSAPRGTIEEALCTTVLGSGWRGPTHTTDRSAWSSGSVGRNSSAACGARSKETTDAVVVGAMEGEGEAGPPPVGEKRAFAALICWLLLTPPGEDEIDA